MPTWGGRVDVCGGYRGWRSFAGCWCVDSRPRIGVRGMLSFAGMTKWGRGIDELRGGNDEVGRRRGYTATTVSASPAARAFM